MRVSLIDAERQLSDLVRRANAGEEVIIDNDSRSAVRLVPVSSNEERDKRWAAVEAIRLEGRRKNWVAKYPFRRRMRPVARVFSTTKMVCQGDRGRYVGACRDRI